MRFGGRRISSNVGSQRGGGFGMPGGGGMGFGGGSLGCGGLAVVIVLALVFGVNPMALLDGGGQMVAPTQQTGAGKGSAEEICGVDEVTRFSCQVLASTEDQWTKIFQAAGQQYRPAQLVFYTGGGRSGCGAAQSAMGPFYCPSDQSIYLDTSFFRELQERFQAPGDFAQAYVIAHEVGHHIQTVTGVADRVRQAQARASRAEGIAGLGIAPGEAALEPFHTLRRGPMGEALRHDIALRRFLQRVVADRLGCPQSLLDVARFHRRLLRRSPHAGITVSLQFDTDRHGIGLALAHGLGHLPGRALQLALGGVAALGGQGGAGRLLLGS